MKFNRILLSALLCFFISQFIDAQTVVLDKEENFPISFATVFNQDGKFVGQTTVDGILPDLGDAKSIRVSHIAYEPLKVQVSSMGKEIKMQPVQIQIGEAVIQKPRTHCIRLTGFLRNFVITNQVYEDEDPIMRFYEGIGQLYVFVDKKKSGEWVDIVARDGKTGDMVDKQKRASLHIGSKSLIEAIKDSKKLDLKDAEGYKQIVEDNNVIGSIVTDEDNHIIRTDIDYLYPDTVKEMNLVVMKIRIIEAKENLVYRLSDDDYVSSSDLLRYNSVERYWTKMMGMRIEGNRFYEFYVDKADYLTEDEYKAAMKENKERKKNKIHPMTSEQLDQYMEERHIPKKPEELQEALDLSKKIKQDAEEKKAAKKDKKEKKKD